MDMGWGKHTHSAARTHSKKRTARQGGGKKGAEGRGVQNNLPRAHKPGSDGGGGDTAEWKREHYQPTARTHRDAHTPPLRLQPS